MDSFLNPRHISRPTRGRVPVTTLGTRPGMTRPDDAPLGFRCSGARGEFLRSPRRRPHTGIREQTLRSVEPSPSHLRGRAGWGSTQHVRSPLNGQLRVVKGLLFNGLVTGMVHPLPALPRLGEGGFPLTKLRPGSGRVAEDVGKDKRLRGRQGWPAFTRVALATRGNPSLLFETPSAYGITPAGQRLASF